MRLRKIVLAAMVFTTFLNSCASLHISFYPSHIPEERRDLSLHEILVEVVAA